MELGQETGVAQVQGGGEADAVLDALDDEPGGEVAPRAVPRHEEPRPGPAHTPRVLQQPAVGVIHLKQWRIIYGILFQ